MESICQVCQNIDFDTLLHGRPTWWERRKPSLRYESANLEGSDHAGVLLGSLQEVRQRASNSCAMCELVLARRTHFQSWVRYRKLVQSNDTESDKKLVWLCSIRVEHSDPEVATMRTNVILVHLVPPDRKDPFVSWTGHLIHDAYQIYAVNNRSSPAKIVNDEVDFDIFRKCVSDCLKHHVCEMGVFNIKTQLIPSAFQQASINAFGPRHQPDPCPRSFKLIDVHSQRIVEDDSKQYPVYTALSYTWGDAQADCCLTKSKISWRLDTEHIRSTPLPSMLPDTVVDAMTVTKKMGLEYLWIDRLCIVQDDELEKHTLIQQMDLVYRNATFCIIALAGTSLNTGLPGVRLGTRKKQQIVKVRDDVTLCLEPLSIDRLFIESRWGNRAWTFQEFALSKRCLIFSEEEVIFQCADIRYRESWAAHENRRSNGYWIDDEGKARTMTDLFRGMGPGIIGSYQRFVEEYTTRSMTFNSDGLNAFAGTSSVMEKYLQSEMIFGMPKRHMLESLAWYIKGASPHRRTQSMVNEKGEAIIHPIFPSWSWVAWDGAVKFQTMKPYEVQSHLFLVKTRFPLHLPVQNYASYFASEDSGSTRTPSGRILSGILPLWAKCAYFNIDPAVPQTYPEDWYVFSFQSVVVLKDGSIPVGYIEVNSAGETDAFPKGAWCMELYTTFEWCCVLVLTAFNYESSEPMFEKLHLLPASQDPSLFHQKSVTKALFVTASSLLGMKRSLSGSKSRAEPTSDSLLLAYRIATGRIKVEAWRAAKLQSRLVLLG